MIIKNATELVGKTPMLLIQHNDNEIYVKLEKYNLTGSVKDRPVLQMLLDMEAEGLNPNEHVLIEATSGNTGIALAALGKARGYRVILVMPESMSIERRQLMQAYGAELILTPKPVGMQGAVDEMTRLLQENPNYRAIWQFDNCSNSKAHYLTTIREILEDVPDFDYFVAGIGTGGTISGAGAYLKKHHHPATIIGVEPAKSPLLTKQETGPHRIQGIGPNFMPGILQQELIDEVMDIEDEEAFAQAKAFAHEYGILIGVSSGAALAAAYKISNQESTVKQKIVVIAPDGGEKYISTGLYD